MSSLRVILFYNFVYDYFDLRTIRCLPIHLYTNKFPIYVCQHLEQKLGHELTRDPEDTLWDMSIRRNPHKSCLART